MRNIITLLTMLFLYTTLNSNQNFDSTTLDQDYFYGVEIQLLNGEELSTITWSTQEDNTLFVPTLYIENTSISFYGIDVSEYPIYVGVYDITGNLLNLGNKVDIFQSGTSGTVYFPQGSTGVKFVLLVNKDGSKIYGHKIID